MLKLGIFVGEDKWMFFREIFDDLTIYNQTEIFKRETYKIPIFNERFNRWLFQRKLGSMLYRNKVCFFEWSSALLMHASNMPAKCGIVTRLHSFELYDWAPSINWNSVSKIIFVSKAMQRKFCELYPDHFHKTEVVYNGVSLEKFKAPNQKSFNFNLGMVCRITPVKRIYEIILMVHDLQEHGYNAQLHIAGEPSDDFRYAAAIYRLVDELKMRDSVHFYGNISDVITILQSIDIFISNSFWEGQQVALLEAMASGCYCLSHFWDGVEEILPPENLYIKENELQKKIVEYSNLSDYEKRKRQDQMRGIVIDNFDIDKNKVRIREIVEETRTSFGLGNSKRL